MLATERHEFIIQKLEADRTVRVKDLAAELSVTEKTIREDLALLEERGLLVRIHGGARLLESEQALLPIGLRKQSHLDRKRTIAEHAVKHIEENDTIILDGGSTLLELARLIPDIPLTVITNDLHIMQEIALRQHVHLYVLGGSRAAGTSSLVGEDAEQKLKQFLVRKAFIGATCVHRQYGLSLITHAEVTLKKTMIERAEQVILLADSTKWNKIGLFPFARFDEVHIPITEAGIQKS
nr:DeoR/GlpR family DNA-binding transcription regulator [Paenibacillus turpanensis]